MQRRPKKRRIVLVNPPISLEERYGRFSGAGNSMPSLGLLSLAAVVRSQGFDVHVIEASARRGGLDETVRRIQRLSPDVVGITATTLSMGRAATLAEQIKAADPQVQIILGGAHVTAVPRETLTRFPQFDLAVLGEGEQTLLDVLEADGEGLQKILGLGLRCNGEVVITSPRPFIRELDRLPFPAWDLLENFPRAYDPPPFRVHRLPAASIVTSRGCPNRCTFCDRSVFGRVFRAYSAEVVLAMVEELQTRYGVRELLIEDDTFVMDRTRVLRICEGLLCRNQRVSWSCLGRVDRMDRELLRIMKRAGCWQIGYGIESGDQSILDQAQKGIRLEQARQAVAWTRQVGIRSKGFFILGFPGETRETLQRTLQFALEIGLDDLTVSFMTPFPGSALHALARTYGRMEEDWDRMNLLNVVFVPKELSKQDLEQAQKKLMRSFYLRPRIIASYGKRVAAHPRVGRRVLEGLGAFVRTAFGGQRE